MMLPRTAHLRIMGVLPILITPRSLPQGGGFHLALSAHHVVVAGDWIPSLPRFSIHPSDLHRPVPHCVNVLDLLLHQLPPFCRNSICSSRSSILSARYPSTCMSVKHTPEQN